MRGSAAHAPSSPLSALALLLPGLAAAQESDLPGLGRDTGAYQRALQQRFPAGAELALVPPIGRFVPQSWRSTASFGAASINCRRRLPARGLAPTFAPGGDMARAERAFAAASSRRAR